MHTYTHIIFIQLKLAIQSWLEIMSEDTLASTIQGLLTNGACTYTCM